MIKARGETKEWTFAEARKHWKPMTRAVQHVGVPGYQFQTGVLWDGSLVFGPLHFWNLEGMKEELAAVGNRPMHVSIGYGDTMRFIDRRGNGNDHIRRNLEEGRLPIPHVETDDGELRWHETVFAHLLDRPFEDGMKPKSGDTLVTHALFKVENPSDQKKEGHLWLYFEGKIGRKFFVKDTRLEFGYKSHVDEAIGEEIPHRFDEPFGFLERDVRYVIPTPAKGNLLRHDQVESCQGAEGSPKNVIEWKVPLNPGEAAELRLILPYAPIPKTKAKKLLELDSKTLLEEARGFWREVIDRKGVINTPDDFINDYLAAVPGQMAQQVGCRLERNLWMYKTSPNHYEGYWPCNAGKALPTLDLRGLTRFSRPVLRSFIDFQSDDIGGLTHTKMGEGEVISGEGFDKRHGFMGYFPDWTANPLLLSHGLELWALASHYRITRDDEWLGNGPGSPMQAILDACDWTIAQRRRTMRKENGEKVAHWGLLPAASAHDWLSGNTISNDTFCIYGMIESVQLLREINHPRAGRMADELNEYRKDLRQRYVEARERAKPLPVLNGTTIPFVPRDVYELDWRNIDWTYTGYGPLRAGAWGTFEPDDELVDQALAFLEAGLPKGEGFYMTKFHTFSPGTADKNWLDISDQDADRHYFWRHYVEYETMWPIGGDLFLQRDDLPRFFEWLFNNLAVVLHHDWQVGVESLDGVPSCAPGDAERWRAIRNMFVNERGGYDGSQQSLWLLQAIPRSWLKAGDRLSVKDMGTHFGGNVDLALEMAEDGNSVSVSARIEPAVEPKEIRMRLRSGDDRPLVSAKVNGEETQVMEKDTVSLPLATRGEYRIEGFFGNS